MRDKFRFSYTATVTENILHTHTLRTLEPLGPGLPGNPIFPCVKKTNKQIKTLPILINALIKSLYNKNTEIIMSQIL